MGANAATQQNINTVNAIILPGWMERDAAIEYLCNECCLEEPLTPEAAERLWRPYRDRVEALPERQIVPPQRLPIPNRYNALVQNFKARTRGPEILDVIRINLMQLVVYQFYVVGDRVDHHTRQTQDWPQRMLLLDRPPQQMPLRVDGTILKINLPHAEHMFSLGPDGAFRIEQGGAFVSVAELEGRMFLKAGYHRSFGFCRSVMNELDASDKCVLVALTRSVPPQLSETFPQRGLRTTVLGPRPPLFSDFFDDLLSMSVRLRRKRYEMHVTSQVVGIDD